MMDQEPAKAAALVAEAKEKGLYLGCAPDTFPGASLRRAEDMARESRGGI